MGRVTARQAARGAALCRSDARRCCSSPSAVIWAHALNAQAACPYIIMAVCVLSIVDFKSSWCCQAAPLKVSLAARRYTRARGRRGGRVWNTGLES